MFLYGKYEFWAVGTFGIILTVFHYLGFSVITFALTTVVKDGWGGYNYLANYEFIHERINNQIGLEMKNIQKLYRKHMGHSKDCNAFSFLANMRNEKELIGEYIFRINFILRKKDLTLELYKFYDMHL